MDSMKKITNLLMAAGMLTLPCALSYGQNTTSRLSRAGMEQKPIEAVQKHSPLQKQTHPLFRSGNGQQLPASSLVLTDMRKADDPTKAKITLNVQWQWETGGGYQIVLDADADTYGAVIPTDGYMAAGDADYSEFEYFLPEDATGTVADGHWIESGSASILIEPGVYDYAVTNPDPATPAVWIPRGPQAIGDDFEFAAGVEYVFTICAAPVQDEDGNDSCYLSLIAPVDMEVVEIISPASGSGLEQEEVTVSVRNSGLEAVSSFVLRLTVDEGTAVEETVSQELQARASMEYTFAAKADLSNPGEHKVKVEVVSDGDLVASNNSLEKTVYNAKPLSLPYHCDFNEASDMEAWIVIDANEDGMTWEWEAADPDDEEYYKAEPGNSGSVKIDYAYSTPKDDYLITMSPLQIPAGDNHISFWYRGGYGTWGIESMKVLWGKSSDPAEMEVLGEYMDFVKNEYEQVAINFNVAEEGDYYFAFYACSPANQMNINIDEVEVKTGKFAGMPDIAVTKVVLPTSGCGLNDAAIGAEISNIGMADVNSITLSYSVDGGTAVEETFAQPLAMGETRIFTFAQTADFSTPDHKYGVVVTATLGADSQEENLENNQATDSVMNFSPAEVPFYCDFTTAEGREQWTSSVGAWVYDDWIWYALQSFSTDALVSRCVALEEGKNYRISVNYQGGANSMLGNVTDDFAVLYGLSGTSMSEWDTLKTYRGINTEFSFVEGNIAFTCEDAGDYSFAIQPLTNHETFFLKSVRIQEEQAYDVRLNSFGGFARMMPVDQTGTEWQVEVEVENRGATKVDSALVVVYSGEQELGRGKVPVGEQKAIGKGWVSIQVPAGQTNQELKLKAVASVEGEEDLNPDNEIEKTVLLMDDIMAYDNVTADMYGFMNAFGVYSDYTECGLPFRLFKADTLTAVSLGWGYLEENQDIVISVYEWDAENEILGDVIYQATHAKDKTTGQIEHDIPDFLLEAGDYMVSVRWFSYALVSDMDMENGYIYQIADGAVRRETGLGFPAIRSVFGHDGIIADVDVAVDAISKPIEEGVFAVNESVVATVTNNGKESVDVPVNLIVNKDLVSTQTVTIPGWSSREVTFSADLSEPGMEYLLTVYTSLEGDEIPANDTAIKIVRSNASPDPYVMNFEYCSDFATGGFNPAWTTVDRDGQDVGGWANFSFPGQLAPAGFIAFNPSATNPSMMDYSDEVAATVAPHGGKRFGMSLFLYEGGTNDDWLISPLLRMPASGAKMEFYVKSMLEDNGNLENYKVLVSTADNNPDSFIAIGDVRYAPATSWEKVEVDLSEYNGKDIYVAIQCTSTDLLAFMIDDISIQKPTANETGDRVDAQLSLYPNPANEMIHILSTDAKIQQVSIFNLSGACLYQSAFAAQRQEFHYNVSSLNAGLYFARVLTNQGAVVLKFMVQ